MHSGSIVQNHIRYDDYVNWFIKTHPDKNLNLRLSPKKLRTHSNREQLIIMMRKHHPWLEEINIFVLKIEVCAI